MADIFQEVDEEVRRERVKQLWDRYGGHILVAAIVFVLAVAGWRAYQWWEGKKAAEAGVQFEAAIALVAQGKPKEAEEAFAKIATDGTAGYKTLARFRAAGLLTESDPKKAAQMFDDIAADTGLGQTLRDLAALRAGIVLADTASYDEVSKRLEPLTAADRPFHHTARAILAMAAWHAHNTAATKKWIEMIVADPQSPSPIKTRAEVLSALMAGAGQS